MKPDGAPQPKKSHGQSGPEAPTLGDTPLRISSVGCKKIGSPPDISRDTQALGGW
jgi:hypothetical protein